MLDGKKILIVEDEVILALDLRYAMEDLGANVIGPCHRLKTALQLAHASSIDAAVLDVDLAGEAVFPLADDLAQRQVPIVFHTGREDPSELSSRYVGARICAKPTSPHMLAKELHQLLAMRSEATGTSSSGNATTY